MNATEAIAKLLATIKMPPGVVNGSTMRAPGADGPNRVRFYYQSVAVMTATALGYSGADHVHLMRLAPYSGRKRGFKIGLKGRMNVQGMSAFLAEATSRWVGSLGSAVGALGSAQPAAIVPPAPPPPPNDYDEKVVATLFRDYLLGMGMQAQSVGAKGSAPLLNRVVPSIYRGNILLDVRLPLDVARRIMGQNPIVNPPKIPQGKLDRRVLEFDDDNGGQT